MTARGKVQHPCCEKLHGSQRTCGQGLSGGRPADPTAGCSARDPNSYPEPPPGPLPPGTCLLRVSPQCSELETVGRYCLLSRGDEKTEAPGAHTMCSSSQSNRRPQSPRSSLVAQADLHHDRRQRQAGCRRQAGGLGPEEGTPGHIWGSSVQCTGRRHRGEISQREMGH